MCYSYETNRMPCILLRACADPHRVEVEHNQKIDGFTECLNIPQLNVEEQESLGKDLTLEELKDALASFADKKSPGEDGFTKEFYQTFFDLIGKDLLNSYNDSFHRRIFVNYTEKRINNTYPKR